MDTRIKEKGITEALMDEKFNMFMKTVDERFRSFVNQINEYLTGNGCKRDIKLQKSGYIDLPLCWMESSIRNAVTWRFSLHCMRKTIHI